MFNDIFHLLLAIVFSYASIFTLVVFYLSYLYIDFVKNKETKDDKFETKNVDVWSISYLVVSIIILLLIIFTKSIWNIMPSSYRKCQFAWRQFGILYFFLAMLLFYILKFIPFKKAYLNGVLALSSCLLIFSQPLIEKQVVEDTAAETKRFGYSDEDVKKIRHSGWLNEFVPQIYASEVEDYEPQYENSLYRKVRRAMVYQDKRYFVYDKEDYYYATLEGKGELTITELDSPSLSFNATVEENALFQVPQFYYEGYIIHVKNLETEETFTLKPINIDVLVSFKLDKGKYECKLTFEGTSQYKAGHVLFVLGLINAVAIAVTGTLLNVKENKKQKNNNS